MSAADIAKITDRLNYIANELDNGVRTRQYQFGQQTLAAIGALSGQVAGLSEALSQVGTGIDVAAIQAAAEKAAVGAVAKFGEALAAADDPADS